MNCNIISTEFTNHNTIVQRIRHVDAAPNVVHSNITVRFSVPTDLEKADQFARTFFNSELGPFSSLKAVSLHDPQSLLVFEYKGELVGGKAMLFLNNDGLCTLKAGHLNVQNPDLKYLAASNEEPVAIYVRLFIAKGRGKLALSHLNRIFSIPRLKKADFYSNAATPEGSRLVRDWSYEPDPNSQIPLLISRRRTT